ncbi:hypothetical protein QNA08_03340 [Chelatococcus sp. SYSU_G07232]|uniref:PilZ domain-containing protein n=1 Tax=Chelatococcus albus TaxID=3047466 RepID=A0ABT7AD24_9HYPH|nr:PilZ domain-containing protein [Chelatococcus sp. SYSU_G07232]MDJ1157273.1 hypothetical protein [Chelatococcus sp. SYSU_G07232]
MDETKGGARMDETSPDAIEWVERLFLAGQDPHEERRRAPRRPVAVPAAIALADGATLYCAIRDVTAAGARLAVPKEAKLPEAFDLALLPKGLTRRVSLKWRRGQAAGVAFL